MTWKRFKQRSGKKSDKGQVSKQGNAYQRYLSRYSRFRHQGGIVNEQSEWSTDTEFLDGCPLASKSTKRIIVMQDAADKMSALLDALDTEWGAYLMGWTSGNEIVVETIYVPPQEVTSGSVEFDATADWATAKQSTGYEVVGVVHSHVDMQVFFSDTDNKHLNANYPCSIVVNRARDYRAVAKVNLDCGRLAIIPATIKWETGVADSEWLDEVTKRIKDATPTRYGVGTPLTQEEIAAYAEQYAHYGYQPSDEVQAIRDTLWPPVEGAGGMGTGSAWGNGAPGSPDDDYPDEDEYLDDDEYDDVIPLPVG